jgi:hypothetical protein
MSILKTLNAKPAASKAAGKMTLETLEAAAAAGEWLAAKAVTVEAEARLEVAETALKPIATRAWFEGNAGKAKPESSILIPSNNGTAMVTFAATWTARGGLDLLPAELVREKWAIKIDGDKIPAAVAEAFASELMALAAKHGVSEAVTAKGGPAPVSHFGEVRHTLPVETNLAAEAAGLGTRITIRAK